MFEKKIKQGRDGMKLNGKIKCGVCADVHVNPEYRQVESEGLPRYMVKCPTFGKEFEFSRELVKNSRRKADLSR